MTICYPISKFRRSHWLIDRRDLQRTVIRNSKDLVGSSAAPHECGTAGCTLGVDGYGHSREALPTNL